ncbi:MAG: AMP-binding protein [Methanobrevibacter sp.]|jgi:non-ribosomal peptide synthetase component F|nr:AMP-binding protein [Candidatus Methanovirga procula]
MCFTIDNDQEYILKCFDSLVFNEPQSKSVKYNGFNLTYGQLDVLVNRIANLLKVKLKTQSLDSNSKSDLIKDKLIIPIFIDKSHFTVASILAVWKLGYSFTVIDRQTPKARFNEIIKQLNTELIIDGDFISELDGLGEDFEKPIDVDSYIGIDDLALVCFTSGTTGTPNGVMINYKQICMASKNISIELIGKYLRSKCVMTLIPSFSMIAAHLITFGVMFSKGYLHIIPDEKILDLHYLIEYMKMNNINGSMFPPQLAEKFLRYADGLLEGFIVSTDKVSNIYSSKTTIINLYGQTETLGFNTHFKIDKPYKNTPIGKPANNNKIYLLDENLEEVNDGVMGEIYVAGQLALGYLNDKKLTDEKFIPNPYSSSNSDKVLYKTGDLAYYNNDGDLVFLQRKDFMINIHGYRVEPTEIENTINKISGVEECVVAGFDVSETTGIKNNVKIYAGVVTENNEEVFDVDKIKNELSELLPVYMIPSVIMKIDSIPLNLRGKIDRTHILPKNILNIYLNKEESEYGFK